MQWLQTFESMLQGGARGQNLGYLKIFFEQPVLFRVDNSSVRQTLGFNAPGWGTRSKSKFIS